MLAVGKAENDDMNFSENGTLPIYVFKANSTSVVIPITTFALGVLSNSLAIASLLCYKFRRIRNRRPSIVPSETSTNVLQDPNLIEARGQSVYEGEVKSRRPAKFGTFHTLVLCLAVLDLLGSLVVSPVTFVLYLKETHILVQGGVSLCNYSAFCMMFFGFATMGMVMAMSVERLISINHPFFYHHKATACSATLSVLILFTLITIVCCFPVMGFGRVRPMYPYSWCFADWNATAPKDQAFNFLYVSLGISMLLVTLFCNIKVIVGLLKMRKRIAFRRRKKNVLSMEVQMIIQLLVITVIFVVCWMPLMVRIFLNQLELKTCAECDRVAIWLVAVNPILDPWVYILFRKSFIYDLVRYAKIIFCYKSQRLSNDVLTKLRRGEPDAVQNVQLQEIH